MEPKGSIFVGEKWLFPEGGAQQNTGNSIGGLGLDRQLHGYEALCAIEQNAGCDRRGGLHAASRLATADTGTNRVKCFLHGVDGRVLEELFVEVAGGQLGFAIYGSDYCLQTLAQRCISSSGIHSGRSCLGATSDGASAAGASV